MTEMRMDAVEEFASIRAQIKALEDCAMVVRRQTRWSFRKYPLPPDRE